MHKNTKQTLLVQKFVSVVRWSESPARWMFTSPKDPMRSIVLSNSSVYRTSAADQIESENQWWVPNLVHDIEDILHFEMTAALQLSFPKWSQPNCFCSGINSGGCRNESLGWPAQHRYCKVHSDAVTAKETWKSAERNDRQLKDVKKRGCFSVSPMERRLKSKWMSLWKNRVAKDGSG